MIQMIQNLLFRYFSGSTLNQYHLGGGDAKKAQNKQQLNTTKEQTKQEEYTKRKKGGKM